MGIVVNVFNSGASDLLQVRLDLSKNIAGPVGMSKVGECDSGPSAWVPFVEAIVPDVDLEKREMLITPPKGLLDLNIPSHGRSKKERRGLVRHNLLYFTSCCQYVLLDYMCNSMSNVSKLPFVFLAFVFYHLLLLLL